MVCVCVGGGENSGLGCIQPAPPPPPGFFLHSLNRKQAAQNTLMTQVRGHNGKLGPWISNPAELAQGPLALHSCWIS